MSRWCLHSAPLLLILFLPTSGHAGANAGASAWLSWDEAGLVTDLKSAPSAAFPLFVHLKNASDVRALAIHLRWSPFDPLGDCYSVLPATSTPNCGWAMAIPPGGDFEGDSSYTWSIQFPPLDPNRTCVQYLVSAGSCAGTIPAADFLLASARVKDSKGAVDTLQVVDAASILGGSLLGIESVDPHEIPARQQTVLAMKGRRFEPGAQVELRSSGLRVAASKVLALGSATITATVLAPDSPGALLDLLVRLPDGRSAQLPAAITIAASPATAQANPSLSKPTNDTAAFRRFDLNADRVASVNVHDHANLGVYPSSLNSNSLLVTRSATDTMGLFRSKPYDGIDFNCGCQGYPSYVDYAITPPQYATSIGLLSMARGVFNGTGEFNDYNAPALRLRWTFADGDTDTAGQTIRVGKHVRNWRSDTPVDCNGPQPYYVLPPDSLAAVLYTGPLPPPWTPGDAYYDAAELPLASGNRSKRLAALRIAAVDHQDNCSDGRRFSTEHFLYGFSIWPNFTVVNGSSQPVVRKSQFTNVDHGGYMFGGIPVGTRRTTNVTACQVASMAMDYTYTGFACTVDDLNAYLQQNRGYDPDQVAIVKSVSPGGNAITFTATGKTVLLVNDTFLVEHGRGFTNPLATYRVTVQYQRQPYVAGQATRLGSPYSATVPSVGDPGRVYWNMRHVVADGITHAPQLRSIDLPDSPKLAAQVESLLVRNIPVQLDVSPRGGHYVVADGWTSSFRPDGSARGTYSIKDPFDDRNFTKLVEGKYLNTFIKARYTVPTGLQEFAGAVAGTDPPGLGILASGARRIEVIDPVGRHMMRDASTGEGVYEIPEATIGDVSSEHDNGGDVDDPLTGYDIDIPITVDGHYTVTAYSDDGLAMSANGYASAGIFASDDVVDTTGARVGNVYDVVYSGSGQTVSVTHIATVGVSAMPSPSGPGLLRVRHSPTTGPVEFVLGGAQAANGTIDVLDITGRRVDAVQVTAGPGPHTVTWDWRTAGVRPGVYFARLRSRGNELTRFVILH